MKKIFSFIVFVLFFLTAQSSTQAAIDFNYQVHVQDIGWMNAVGNGAVAGTTGRSLRMEAFVIHMTDDYEGMVEYCAHVQDIGWMDWCESGEIAGTVGEEKRLEAIRINLVGRYARKYDIYYRAHVQDGGWLGWAMNGEPAGTSGASLRMEAIQIQLVPKGKHFNRGGSAFYQRRARQPNYI